MLMSSRLKFDLNTLANEMLDSFDPALFESKTTTFLDPAMAGGQFLKAIEDRLRLYGHSDKNIAKRVTGYAENHLYMGWSKKYRGIISHMEVKKLNEIEDMDFDVTIGNPPYQNVDKKNKNAKLWYDFGVRCANLNSEVIALVTPEAAFKDIDSNGKKLRKHLKELGYGIITVERHERGDYFDVGVDTCHWILSKKSDKDIDSAIFSYTDQKIVDICEKVVSYPKKLAMVTENDVANAELSESGRYEFYRSGLNKSCTDKTLSNIGKKIIFPFSASYKSLFFSKEPSGSLNKVVAVKSKNEAEQVIAYCLSDLFIFVANNYRKTSGFCPFVKKGLIPDLRGVDTQDLYALFGLTKDEIALVEGRD